MPEIALKFPPEQLRAVRDHPRLRELATARGAGRAVAFTYFDTVDGHLYKHGITIRIIRTGARFRQVVTAGGATVFESTVEQEFPRPDLIADPSLRHRVMAVAPSLLTAVFRGDARILRRPIRLSETCAGVAEVESGTLAAAVKENPYAVLRLGLDGEDRAPLFDLALELGATVPLRLCPRNPAEYAFDLVVGGGPNAVKADKSPLEAEATVEESLIHVVRGCLDHLVANESCTLDSDHPEGIHQMRVAMRRLRSALRFYRDMIPSGQYGWLVGEIKWLTSQFGPTRDLDVFLGEIVAPVAEKFPDEAAFRVLEGIGQAARDEARATSREALRTDRYVRFILEAHRWAERRSWRDQALTEEGALLFQPALQFADAVLAKCYKKVRARGRHFAVLDATERHRLRIQVKKLRYALDFFSSLYRPRKVKEFAERLARMQDDMGYANDVRVAHGLVANLESRAPESPEARRASALTLGWHAHALSVAEGRIGGEVASFLSSKTFWDAG